MSTELAGKKVCESNLAVSLSWMASGNQKAMGRALACSKVCESSSVMNSPLDGVQQPKGRAHSAGRKDVPDCAAAR